jgi:hypothetical protein
MLKAAYSGMVKNVGGTYMDDVAGGHPILRKWVLIKRINVSQADAVPQSNNNSHKYVRYVKTYIKHDDVTT